MQGSPIIGEVMMITRWVLQASKADRAQFGRRARQLLLTGTAPGEHPADNAKAKSLRLDRSHVSASNAPK